MYVIHYFVIIIMNCHYFVQTGLYRSTFYAYSFGKLVFHRPVFSSFQTAMIFCKAARCSVIFLSRCYVSIHFVTLVTLCNNFLSHFAVPVALCNNLLSHFLIPVTLCNNFLPHFVIPAAPCNNFVSHFVITTEWTST